MKERDTRDSGEFDAEGNYILEDTGESIEDVVEQVQESVSESAEEASEPAPDLSGLEAENAKLRDQYVRKLADFENFRRRTDREKAEFFKYALADFMRDLLPVLDNFERAIAVSGDAPEEYRRGLELIQKQLLETTGRYGLSAIDAAGVPFDPQMHEGIMREEDPTVPSHTVTEVLQKGYFLHDRLLRPAMVKVAVGGAEPDALEGAEEI